MAIVDYRVEKSSLRHNLQRISEGIGLMLVLDYLFYMRWISLIWLSGLGYLWFIVRRKAYCRKRIYKLTIDFREVLDSMAVTLRGGFS
ncbi:MAG: hypothetical protein KBS83_04420, partial [Lachnospiraceae bacterium]|nr:hypothetical protein [Candidatus Equihabitans merdae]